MPYAKHFPCLAEAPTLLCASGSMSVLRQVSGECRLQSCAPQLHCSHAHSRTFFPSITPSLMDGYAVASCRQLLSFRSLHEPPGTTRITVRNSMLSWRGVSNVPLRASRNDWTEIVHDLRDELDRQYIQIKSPLGQREGYSRTTQRVQKTLSTTVHTIL